MSEPLTPTLLLVDHNPQFAYLIERYSESTGWRLVWTQAVSGAEIQLKSCIPNIILLNLLLPAESGWCFLKNLKSCPETREIPVAVYSSVPDEARALKEGADYYLWQPVLFQDFSSMLAHVPYLK